jgi:hypothetical protein
MQLKFKSDQKMRQRQMMTNDLYGRLFAEIERLYRCCGVHLTPRYHKYLLSDQPNITGVLSSIEGQIGGISRMTIIAENEGAPPPNMPSVEEDIERWVGAYNSILDTEANKVPKAVLSELLNMFLEKKPSKLSAEVSEMIFKSADRRAICRDWVQNHQTDILVDIVGASNLQEKIISRARELEDDPRAVEFPRTPQFDISKEDMPRKNFSPDQDRRQKDDQNSQKYLPDTHDDKNRNKNPPPAPKIADDPSAPADHQGSNGYFLSKPEHHGKEPYKY